MMTQNNNGMTQQVIAILLTIVIAVVTSMGYQVANQGGQVIVLPPQVVATPIADDPLVGERAFGANVRTERALRVQNETQTGTLLVDRTSAFTGNVTAAGNLAVTGDTTLTGDLAVDDVTSTGNLIAGDFLRLTSQAAISVTNGGILTPTGSLQPITSAGTVTPTISVTGRTVGDVLILVNTSATTINIADSGNVLQAGAIALGQHDTIFYTFNGTAWRETSRVNN